MKIPLTEPELGKKEFKEVQECFEKNWITMGAKTLEFEEKFAKYCKTDYALMTNNGTTALHLVLSALEISPKDEVIVPTLTFLSTAAAVSYCGAKPIFVDVERDTYCIDLKDAENNITEKTKAIIPVHLYGHPADMDAVADLADKYHLLVIEDAAEAHGAEIKGQKVGSFGDAGIFSFYGNKIITTGEGGMVTTNDKKLYEKMKILRNQGMDPDKKYWHPYIGFNYRPTDMQAAIGLAQLQKINTLIEKKRRLAKWYTKLLKRIDGIEPHKEKNGYKNVYWMYSPLVTHEFGISAEELRIKLYEEGIDTRPFFPCLHWQPPYKENKNLEVAEELARSGINLPSSPKLKKKEVELVVDKIKENART